MSVSPFLYLKHLAALREVSFEGNTDSDGDSECSMWFSDNRANAMMEFCSSLLDDMQTETFDKLAACRGYDELDLAYGDKSQEDKDASRRIAIKFMMKVDDRMAEAESKQIAGTRAVHRPIRRVRLLQAALRVRAAHKRCRMRPRSFRASLATLTRRGRPTKQSESNSTEHFVGLLLSDVHRHCTYVDLKVESSAGAGNCTFGETSVKDTGDKMQIITVKHDANNDKLNVVFNAWKSNNKMSVTDSWGGANNLTAYEDIGAVISTFEEVLT